MSEPRVLDPEEFRELGDKVMSVFRDAGLNVRDSSRILMMMSCHICMQSAPGFSVGLSELTKCFIYTLYPEVADVYEVELKGLVDDTEIDDEPEIF